MIGPLSTGDVIKGRYEIAGFVGEGGMQFVYAANDKLLNRTVALKTPKNDSASKRFVRSAIVAARVNHPNVAKTLDYLEENDRKYLVEELIEGGDLKKAILEKAKCLDPYLAARVFHNLAKGLAASHHAGVIHRDLKPTNVMVTGGFHLNEIKITDFGIAKMAEDELVEAAKDHTFQSLTAIGALPYMSPEFIDTPKDVGKPTDVWSIGAMMYELLTGEKPFGSGFKAVDKILKAQPPEFPSFLTSKPQFASLSKTLIDLVLLCLQKDPAARPTADILVEHCGNLYYPVVPRYDGVICDIQFNSYGLITIPEENVFFHMDSVYGEYPKKDDRVMLSKFPGGGRWRAHPVVKLS